MTYFTGNSGSAAAAAVALPTAAPAPGQLLWGEPRRRQPVAALVVLALITLLVAAPAAMSGQGESSNPITLMHNIAENTYSLTGLMHTSNSTLAKIQGNVQPLAQMNDNMTSISASAQGMDEKTKALNEQLGGVNTAVSQSAKRLVAVDGKLTQTAGSLGALRGSVNGSLKSTNQVVTQFTQIDAAITSMDSGLAKTITLMSASTPLTSAFATNTTRQSIVGGDGHKFNVPNVVPNSRVMSVVLPMINTMQNGGGLGARKNSADSSNFLVRTLLNKQVPDGTNVTALVQPFDGYYGLPKSDWFVAHQVGGF